MRLYIANCKSAEKADGKMAAADDFHRDFCKQKRLFFWKRPQLLNTATRSDRLMV